MSEGYGIKESGKVRKHTGEFKLAVIQEIRENKISYTEAGRKHKISHSVFQKWERIFFRRRIRRPIYRTQRSFIKTRLSQ